jgi:hypothetical protein
MRVGRIIGVTLGLAATGAVAGALLGMLVLTLVAFVSLGLDIGELRRPYVPSMLLAAAAAGSAVGAVLAPAAAWALLRYVPLGRAIGQTALGAVLGATIGLLIGAEAAIYGTLIGFCAAAVRLRLVTPKQRFLPPAD